MEPSILIVDDDTDFLDILRGKLRDAGIRKITAEDRPLAAAARIAGGAFFDIALIDMTMPEMDGLELLEKIKEASPRTECIMVTAVNDARVAVECLKRGAYDYLVKPVPQEDLVFSLKRTQERKRLMDLLDVEKGRIRPRLDDEAAFKQILTRSEKMRRVLKEAELHAGSDVPVLITGESGTGKELLARALHLASPRSQAVFTPVNMASISAGLFESEFFGHTRGAFTGAESSRAGYLEHTSGGTLFLDEIGNMPPELQGKLLRVLQDGEYTKLGTSRQQKADIRIVAATNADLDRQMADGRFRKDLYYRIRGGGLHLPPLRERIEDIPMLAAEFLRAHCSRGGPCRITDDAMGLFVAYDWPGNVRELKAVVQAAANLSQGGPIAADMLPDRVRRQKAVFRPVNATVAGPIFPLAQIERRHILRAYAHTGSNKSQTAKLLGIGLNTLRRKLRSYGVD